MRLKFKLKTVLNIDRFCDSWHLPPDGDQGDGRAQTITTERLKKIWICTGLAYAWNLWLSGKLFFCKMDSHAWRYQWKFDLYTLLFFYLKFWVASILFQDGGLSARHVTNRQTYGHSIIIAIWGDCWIQIACPFLLPNLIWHLMSNLIFWSKKRHAFWILNLSWTSVTWSNTCIGVGF